MWNYNYFIYITTNPGKAVLYIGVTNDLKRRLFEHHEKKGKKETFAGKYYCYNLVYYEHFKDITEAIKREKELKGWSRKKKDVLIKTTNPNMDFIQLD
jgi:putative endonuclease